MQAVGADRQVEAALAGLLELNLHKSVAILEAEDIVAEDGFRRASDLFEQSA